MSYFSSACLRISGDDVNPGLCSALLKIEPDRAWAKGEIYRHKRDGSEARRYTGLWLYASKLAIPPYDPDLHAREIVRVFQGKGEAFDDIRKQGRVRISLIIDWGISHGTYYLDKGLLRDILNLGVDDVGYCFVGIDEDDESHP